MRDRARQLVFSALEVAGACPLKSAYESAATLHGEQNGGCVWFTCVFLWTQLSHGSKILVEN